MQRVNEETNGLSSGALQSLGTHTLDLVVDHELHGVTPEMLQWWWWKMVDPDFYRLWHPKDHVSIAWEVPPTGGRLTGAIRSVEERIGEFPVRKLRIRLEDPASSPIPATYRHVNATSVLGPDGKAVAWITHEYEAASYGTKMRSTFRLSADTPQPFIDALRQHNREEMGRFAEFLPDLYRKNAKESDPVDLR